MTIKACTGMVLNQFELSKITLKNLNKFDLSPTAKLVLLALVDCYNPRTEEIFPKQSTIAGQLGINISSVKRAIKELAASQIIIYETKNTNRYKITSKFFEVVKLPPVSAQKNTSSSLKLNPACHEQINLKNKEHTSSETLSINNQPNDDVDLKNSIPEEPDQKESVKKVQYSQEEKARYKAIVTQLESWHFTGGQFSIKNKGIEHLEKLIKIVEKLNPDNKGGYLRRLLMIPDFKPVFKEEHEQETRINKIKELLDNQDKINYLNSYDLAKIQMQFYDYHKKLTDKELFHVITLIERWNFNNYNEFRILYLLENMKVDPEFNIKYLKITKDIEALGIKYHRGDLTELNEPANKGKVNNIPIPPEFFELKEKLKRH